MSAGAKLAKGVNTKVHGFADFEVGPVVLQWVPRHLGKGIFVQRAVLDQEVTTDKYSNLRPVNIGSNAAFVNLRTARSG